MFTIVRVWFASLCDRLNACPALDTLISEVQKYNEHTDDSPFDLTS